MGKRKKLGEKLEPVLSGTGCTSAKAGWVRVGSGVALKVETAMLQGICYS